MNTLPEPTLPLSVVATSRNDNHGGGLTQRMQHFVDGFIMQCKRHNVRAELIMVEWNPPEGRQSLRDELKWPDDLGPCEVRVVTFPREMHADLPHSQYLPLYQMIAKNVGIVRARGRFVLATNIDIIFSDQIMLFMRDHLVEGRLYRVERHDIPSELPALADFGQLIDWCWKNTFRINANGLTFPTGVGIEPPTRFQLIRGLIVRLIKRVLWRIGREFTNIGWAAAQDIRAFRRDVAALFGGDSKRPEVTPSELEAGAADTGFGARLVKALASAAKIFFRPLRYIVRMTLHSGPALRAAWRQFGEYLEYRRLFTNACGDFTLMSRADWFKVHGYAEWPIYSFHIDSLVLLQADRAGIKEVHLGRDHSVFHIEHDAGSGFTPEHAHKLFERLKARGIPYLEWGTDVMDLKKQMDGMRERHEPIAFNGLDWGYQNVPLAEERVESRKPAPEFA